MFPNVIVHVYYDIISMVNDKSVRPVFNKSEILSLNQRSRFYSSYRYIFTHVFGMFYA